MVREGLAGFKQVLEQKSNSYLISATKLIPRKVFFTTGVGRHKDALVSFELALRDAGIEKFNLVTVSSIFPPGCKIVSAEDGLKELFPGQIVFCVMSRMTSNERGRIFASLGAAIPPNSDLNGYLTEYHGYCDGRGKNCGRECCIHAENNFWNRQQKLSVLRCQLKLRNTRRSLWLFSLSKQSQWKFWERE